MLYFFLLILIIPVTTASADIVFEIKNYLRSTMSQCLLSIENKRTQDFIQDYLINLFAESEIRKKDF